jgi:hypothetical protein
VINRKRIQELESIASCWKVMDTGFEQVTIEECLQVLDLAKIGLCVSHLTDHLAHLAISGDVPAMTALTKYRKECE